MKFRQVTALLVMAVAPLAALAHGVQCGDIAITHPYATPSPGTQASGAVYFVSIKNKGQRPELLLGASSELASRVEIHATQLNNGTMQMRPLPAVPLPVGQEVSFKHNQAAAYHLMLIGLKKPFQEGDSFAVTLQFKNTAACRVPVSVVTPRHLARMR